MTPLVFALVVALISTGAGMLGALLGLGGGLIVVPALTLLLGVDIRFAIGASVVSVIATSSGAAASYVKEHLTNLRVAMFLELATTTGAMSGAWLAGRVSVRWLFLVFGAVLAYSSLASFRKLTTGEHANVAPDRWADVLNLHGSYWDKALGMRIWYRVGRTPLGFVLMYVAGIVSGLLGIGSGALKVPAMDLAMGIPIKASSATSNFMIGVTAAASAGVYFARGEVDPFIAGPVCLGVLVGAMLGSHLLNRLHSTFIRILFVLVLLWIAGQMLIHGLTR